MRYYYIIIAIVSAFTAAYGADIHSDYNDYLREVLERTQAHTQMLQNQTPQLFPQALQLWVHTGPILLDTRLSNDPQIIEKQLETQVEIKSVTMAYAYICAYVHKAIITPPSTSPIQRIARSLYALIARRKPSVALKHAVLKQLSADEFVNVLKQINAIVTPLLNPDLQGQFRTDTTWWAPLKELGVYLTTDERGRLPLLNAFVELLQNKGSRNTAILRSYRDKYKAAIENGLPLAQAGFTLFEKRAFASLLPEFSAHDLEERLKQGFNTLKTIEDPFEFAASLHHLICAVHSFHDGNGRTSRIFANWALVEAGKSPMICIPDKQKYLNAVCHDRQTNITTNMIALMKQQQRK